MVLLLLPVALTRPAWVPLAEVRIALLKKLALNRLVAGEL